MRFLGWLGLCVFVLSGISVLNAQSTDFSIQSPVEYVYETDLRTGNIIIPVQWETELPVNESTEIRIQQVIANENLFEVQIAHVGMWWDEGLRMTYAAPHFVTGTDELRLHVQFVQNAEVRATSDLSFPIRPGGRSIRVTPQVSRFDITSVQPLSSSHERLGIGINWWVDNVPTNANLAFEQILPDSTILNIEQQRQELQIFPMGEGFGVVQVPFSPTKVIILRVRLYDLQTGYVYAYDAEATTYSVPTETIEGTIREQPTPTALPNLSPTNESNATVIRFEVSPRSVARGEPFTVTWDIAGAQQNGINSDIRIFAEGSDYRGVTTLASFLPVTGSVLVELPSDNPQYLESAQVWIQGSGAVSERITVQVICPYTPLVGEDCPQTGATDATVVYQAFEHGFMIAYADTIIAAQNGGFVLYSSGEATIPPETLTAPDPIFQTIWRSTIEDGTPIYDLLGGATADIQSYTGTWQRIPDLRSTSSTSISQDYITLPDGSVLTVSYSFSRPVQWNFN
ncbi:MAG: hypothetical protein OHK0046_38840 [Anaerolineae bacterium]